MLLFLTLFFFCQNNNTPPGSSFFPEINNSHKFSPMIKLSKTQKFSSWTSSYVPTEMSSSQLDIKGNVTVGGGRKVIVHEVAKVAVLRYSVTLDVATLQKVEEDALTRVQIPLPLSTLYSSSSLYEFEENICRACVFARIVSIMQARLGIRTVIVELLSEMLNNGVVPIFSSEESAGQELVFVISGIGGSCYTPNGKRSAQDVFEIYNFSSVQLTAAEADTLAVSQFFVTGLASLLVSGASNVVGMLDIIASISCEAFGASSDAFDAINYDVCRQHRGQINSSTNLRTMLEGSKRANSADMTSVPASACFQSIPQINGPAQETVLLSVKVIELELNSAENGSLSVKPGALMGFHPCQSKLAVRGIVAALDVSAKASRDRQKFLATSSERVEHVIEKALLCSAVIDDDFSAAFDCLTRCGRTLASELVRALRCINSLEATLNQSVVPLGENEENGGVQEAVKKGPSGLPEGTRGKKGGSADDENLTPEQRARIDAKRKAKEEKAAAKQQQKKEKRSGGQRLVLGMGSNLVRAFLAETLERAGDIDSEAFRLTDPFNLSDNSFSCYCSQLIEQLGSGGKRKPKIAKGARDFNPEQMRIREQVFASIRRVFKRHGAVEIDTPVFELKEVLTGKYGEDSKLIYDLADQGGELLSLRYDLTVPFARFLAMNSVGNIKRYHIAKVYRRDNPQLAKGRFREFYQCDFDIAGSFPPMLPDAEVITVATEILSSLPIGKFMIKLNHRKILDAVFEICGVPVEKFRPICSAVDKLDKATWDEVKNEMVEEKGLPAYVADRIGKFVLNSGSPKELWTKLTDEKQFGDHEGAASALQDLQLLFTYLEAMGSLQYVSFDLSLARGLDYYTGVIYEVVLTDGSTQMGSIAAGGRYDNLVGMFSASGSQTPCVGVSIGVERVFTIMEKKAEALGLMHSSNVQVYIASIGADLIPERMKVARRLWTADVSAEYSNHENPKFKKQLDEALERAIPFMVVFGKEELLKNVVKIKDMKNHEEVEVSVEDMCSELVRRGCAVIPAGADINFLNTMISRV